MERITFKQLNVSKDILRGLDKMGFEETTPVQGKAITPMMEGRDVMVQAPTGTGKTCAFGIPVIEAVDTKNTAIQSMILCPTRELAIQTTVALQKLALYKPGVKIVAVYGGERIERQMVALRRRPQVVVATPGRMMDHIQRKTIKLSGLNTIVLDEADRMLDMGFREDLDEILKSVPTERQTVLFSATLSKEIMRIAKTYQKDASFIQIGQDTLTVDSVTQYYAEIRGRAKTPAIIKLLEEEKFKLSLVFVNTKSMADELADKLSQSGFKAEALHGDLRQRQRDIVMDRYRRGLVDILVATDVAARGIDVYNIDAVINYDIPQDSDCYVHRIGRTGRANKNGVAYTFIYPKERPKLQDIIRHTKTTITPVSIEVPFVPAPRWDENGPADDKRRRPLRKDEPKSFKDRPKPLPVKAKREWSDTPPSKKVWTDTPPDQQAKPQAARPKKVKPKPIEGKPDTDSARMFISLGNFDNIKPKQMVELITAHAGIPAKEIGQISIYDKFSFFDIPPKYAKKVIADMCGKEHNKRTITVEASNKEK